MSPDSKNDSLLNEIALRAADGDDGAMAELISVIMPAAKAKAAKLNSKSARISDDDLVQEGMIGFLESVKRFDPSKGVPFRAYANLCIESRIMSALKKNSNDRNAALTTAVSIDDNSEEPSGEDPALMVAANDEAARLYAFMQNSLSPFEKKVLELKLEDRNYSQISESLNCSEKSVDNAIQRIRKKLSKKD